MTIFVLFISICIGDVCASEPLSYYVDETECVLDSMLMRQEENETNTFGKDYDTVVIDCLPISFPSEGQDV